MRYTLLSFLCAATVIAYLQRSALGVPSKQIGEDLDLSAQNMGLVWLAWYAGYAVFQIPSGWVADRLGSKPALILFAILWSVLTAATSAATGFIGLCAVWGAMGVAQAGIFVCATKAIGATFPKTEQAFASGALACSMAAGAALSQYVTGQLLGPLTWQEILLAYMVPGLAWAVAFALIVPRPENPAPAPEPADEDDWAYTPPAPTEPPLGAPVRWSRLLTDRQMVLLCVQQFQRAGAAALFFTWFPRDFLQETKHVTPTESGRPSPRGRSSRECSAGCSAASCPIGCCANRQRPTEPTRVRVCERGHLRGRLRLRIPGRNGAGRGPLRQHRGVLRLRERSDRLRNCHHPGREAALRSSSRR